MKNKKYDYFDGFASFAKLASSAASYLDECMRNFGSEQFKTRVDEMHKIENEADMLKHEMMKVLSHEFITSIEREDIVALCQEMDNVLDSIDDVVRRIYMYNVKKLRPEALEFSALIVKACLALEEVIADFKHFKKSQDITKNIIKVNTIENNGDALHFKYMRKLFTEETDSKTIQVWTMLFEAFEQCFDACEHVVDIIESVVMKNT